MSDEESDSGLPWPRTWNGVYRLVLACFVVYVLALLALKVRFT